jgi:hypothetical protein
MDLIFCLPKVPYVTRLVVEHNPFSFVLKFVKMTRWLVRLLSQEAGKWSGTSIYSGICTVEQ